MHVKLRSKKMFFGCSTSIGHWERIPALPYCPVFITRAWWKPTSATVVQQLEQPAGLVLLLCALEE